MIMRPIWHTFKFFQLLVQTFKYVPNKHSIFVGKMTVRRLFGDCRN